MNPRLPNIIVLVAVGTLGLQGCRDAARPLSPTPTMSLASAEPAPLVPRIIAPQTTDPEINWIPTVNPQFNHHYVWLDPSQTPRPKLFVFLAGTGGRPRGYQLVQQEAARQGYYAIGLMYQNNVAVVDACTGSPDPDCSGNMRLEIIDGVDRSSAVQMSPENSIDNRLTKLLLYLDAPYPGERWSRFLKDGSPKWSRIAVGGHSQGAGQAALIGKIRHVNRVVLLSGPPDRRIPELPDAWISVGETPAAKYFGLFHQRDHFGTAILANFRAFDMGLFGEPVVAELGVPPYGGTHVLVTDLEPTGGYGIPFPHQSSAVDARTPLGADGSPLLREAWCYLLGDPGDLGNDAEDGSGL